MKYPPGTPRVRTHPRSCGENRKSSERRPNRWGSSPLMRGKRRVWRCLPNDVGLIPAHAGKTCLRFRTRWRMRAHPRSCGENIDADLEAVSPQGSSPLMRGKRREADAARASHRLIPAHAGKTSRPPWALSPAWAHPHSRGENGISFVRAIFTADSSPLMRGKRGVLLRALSGPGLIPAHAGKTSMALQRSPRSPAHPRSRGENQLALCVARDV